MTSELVRLIMSENSEIRLISAGLFNQDRRQMLQHISEFMEYLAESLGSDRKWLGENQAAAILGLEAHYYGWLARRASSFDPDIYNIARDVLEWRSAGSSDGRGCTLARAVVSSIYNMTGGREGYWGAKRHTTVGAVISALGHLGYSPETCREMMLALYKTPSRLGRGSAYRGIIETDRFFDVRSARDFTDASPIWLTPRAEYVCLHLPRRFLYMSALLEREGMRVPYDGHRQFVFDPTAPVSAYAITAVLRFLCWMASMHTYTFSEYSRVMRTRRIDDGLDWFARHFNISSSETDGRRSFELVQIIEEYVRYFITSAFVRGPAGNQRGICMRAADAYGSLLVEYLRRIGELSQGRSAGSEVP